MSAIDPSNTGSGPSADNDQYSESLPSSTTSSSSGSSDELAERELTDAEREWQESLQQLELLLTMVLIPFIGKYYGRKFAYWGWAKYMQWKHPLEVMVTTHPREFKVAGAVQAAASL